MSSPSGQAGAGPGADLLGGPAPTLLPEEPAAAVAAALAAGDSPAAVAAAHPAASLAWAVLAEAALDQAREAEAALDPAVTAYALARTGYHRGLDALRRAGWKGRGPVPWAHVPNQGVLRSIQALATAADFIGEADEAERCRQLLRDSDPSLG